jgi:RecA/RadA recombinase
MKKIQERDKAIKAVIAERLAGEETLYMGDPALQWGMGGIVRGKCNLVYGPSGSGKTGLVLIWAGEEQKRTGGWVIIFDSEYAHSSDSPAALKRYRQAGIDTDKLIVLSSNEPNVLFGNLGELEKDIKKGDLNVAAIIVDSWGGVQGETAKKKLEEGDVSGAGNSYGGNAKLMGPILQHLLRLSAENAITMLFVQHTMMNMAEYGPRYLLIGGQKLRFLVHGILFVESIQAKDASLLDGEVASKDNEFTTARIGKKIRFRCEKSRMVVEGRKGEFWMDFENLRFARPGESLYNLASNLGLIANVKEPDLEDKGPNKGQQKKDKKTGELVFKIVKGWFEYPAGAPGAQKFHGEAQTIDALTVNKQFYDEVYAACMQSKTLDAAGGVKMGEELGFVGEATDEPKAKKAKKGKAS